jgi:DNA-binding CsgD family transcriptional regulator
VAEGLTNEEIAHRLCVTVHTAISHVRNVIGKLRARSRAEAVTIGFRSGLIT